MSEFEEEEKYIIVPPEKISKSAFEALVEEFILREGTDYGAQEISLEAKYERALKQIEKGIVKIVYDPKTESCTILKSIEL